MPSDHTLEGLLDAGEQLARAIERDALEQALQGLEAALQVPDRVSGQRYLAAPAM